jgi:EmrB/QacA subfamily drug resistance transporter
VIGTRDRNIALLVAGCFFMEMLDGTIVTTATPQISGSLKVAPTAVGLVITAYLLTVAVLIPASGWLIGRCGVRVVLLSAIALFSLASLGCALSGDLTVLVVMRILQGAGGAMMVPVGRTVVLARTEKQDLMRVMSYIVWPGLIAPVIAPLAGALLTEYASWRWIFLINVPLGIVAFTVTWRIVDAMGREATPPPLDRPGLLLTSAGLGGLAYAAHLVSESGTAWPLVALLFGCSAGLLALAARHLLRTAYPLIALDTLRVATFRLSQSGMLVFWLVVGAGPYLLPLLFQDLFRWSPVRSGAVVLLVFAGNIAIKPATTPLLNRFGFRPVLLLATLGLAGSMLALGFVTAATPLLVTGALCLLSGVFRSIGLTAYNIVALSDIPPERMRDANTVTAITQQLAVGLAVAIAVIALRAGRLLPGGDSVPYTFAFGFFCALTALPVIGALRLGARAGEAVRKPVRHVSGRTDRPGVE